MTLSNLRLLILGYVQRHPSTKHKTIVDVLSGNDWARAHRVRTEISLAVSSGLLIRTGASARNWTYHLPTSKTT